MAPIFAYWDIRGLAQPIRILLNYLGVEFEDKMYKVGPDMSREDWLKEKFSLSLDFPNLPYYVDGDLKLTQSNAILRYIARKHDMAGKTEQEKNRVDLLAEQSMDFRNGWVRLCYNPKFDELKVDYLKNLPSTLDLFEKFLGDRKWFAGENLTFVDFVMYELLDQHAQLTSVTDNWPKLAAFLKRFEEVPEIKKYMESPKFMKSPMNNRIAKFGNK